MVMSIEEARRLVNNRRRREAYKYEQEQAEHLENIYELDEMLAVYLAENSDYIGDIVQAGIENSYGTDSELPVMVCFDNQHPFGVPMCDIPEDICEVAQYLESDSRDLPAPEVMACVFDPRHSEIEADMAVLAWVFCEVVADMYVEAGWQVSDINDEHWIWTYPNHSWEEEKHAPEYPQNGKRFEMSDYGPIRCVTCFELYYS